MEIDGWIDRYIGKYVMEGWERENEKGEGGGEERDNYLQI